MLFKILVCIYVCIFVCLYICLHTNVCVHKKKKKKAAMLGPTYSVVFYWSAR